MSFWFPVLVSVVLLAVQPRGIFRLVVITLAFCCLWYGLSSVDWGEAPSGAGSTEDASLAENARAKRRPTEATRDGFSAQGAAEDGKIDDVRKSRDAENEVANNNAWKGWPSASPYCSTTLAQSFDGFFTKVEATFYIAKCAHASAGNVQALAYAGSQNGSTAAETVRTLINFANAAHTYPSEFARCLQASGVKPKDASGAWRDMTDLLLEYSRRSQDHHSCIRLLTLR